jgi:hypothetical protein
LLYHAFWVAAEVNRVGKPGDSEFDLARSGFDVRGVFRVPGFSPVTYSPLS